MKLERKWNEEEKMETKSTLIMTKRGYNKFKEMIKQEQVSSLIEDDKTIVQTYGKWEKKIMDAKRKCQIRVKKKRIPNIQKTLMSAKSRIKKNKHKGNSIAVMRRQQITKYIEKEARIETSNRIKENIKRIRKNGGGVKEETFWEFRKKIRGKKKEQPHVMKDKEGKVVEERKEILKIYEEFYNELFKRKGSDT